MKKRFFAVKREVYAETLEKAIHAKGGRVYEVVELNDPKAGETQKKRMGFKSK